MKTRVILSLDEGLTKQEKYDVKQLLVDALGDFCRVRHNNEAAIYVRERYGDYMSDGQLQMKMKEVEARVALANKLKHAAYDVLIAEAEDKP